MLDGRYNAIGRDLGPRVSSCLHSGLTADCTSLEIGDHKDVKTGKEYNKFVVSNSSGVRW